MHLNGRGRAVAAGGHVVDQVGGQTERRVQQVVEGGQRCRAVGAVEVDFVLVAKQVHLRK